MPADALTHSDKVTRSDSLANPVSSRDEGHRPPKIRVCHVSMTLQTGGLEKRLVEFSKHHADRFELQFVTLEGQGQPARELLNAGCRVESVASVGGSKWTRLLKLRAIMRRDGIQIVHTHNTYAHFYGALAAKLARVPVVLNSQHGRGCGPRWKARAQFRIANRMTDRIVGVSQDCAALCRGEDAWSASKTTAIWNGIDLGRFEYHGPARQPVAISVARLSPEKDMATLLHAVEIVVQKHPEFRLRIVGDGPERAALEQLASERSLTANVEFLGERHDVPDLLRHAGFFVSATKSEGVSLTLLEAMAVGLPVVTTCVGGNPEVVLNGTTGRLVDPQCPAQLAQAITDMLELPETWPVMGELGRQRVEQHFDVRQTVREYERLYLELLGAGSGLRNFEIGG